MRTDQEYRNIEAENARLAAEIERLTKELDRSKAIHKEDYNKLCGYVAEIERERTARKTAQESLEKYKGECTRLQHEVDRLKGEGAVDRSERT